MARAPTVSVVMATYNGAEWVPTTVSSLLHQSFMDFELVVVDDCSKDDTRAVLAGIEDPRIRIIHAEENRGPVHSRNRGFAAARGRYIAALDQDDLCHPDRLMRQVAYLDANPDTVLVASAADLLAGNRILPSSLPAVTTPGFLDWLMRLSNPIVWSSVMFRADAARRLDPITRPDRLYAEDFDLYHRLRPFGAIARLDEPLLLYRVHEGGASQRFTERLALSAGEVLAEANAAVLGEEAQAGAALLVRHVMLGEPVPDLPTLDRLTEVIERVHLGVLVERDFDAESMRLIEDQLSQIWWRLARTGLRSGRIGWRCALEARPEAVAPRPPSRSDLMLSGLIGRVRALRRA